ncbi:uncharacterized protein LOC125552542 [Triticum urartu]|uniref:uncharacterized protein LOC125552541 n=1 Tax=Triticum urartu TaxID=4572 RepID=UPI0020433117|nr:uncharacterized protein LOC125552541 [Triticum urartu]XP_048572102.1 uncharacterized protein LOC125552542 [Triticum urartu]
MAATKLGLNPSYPSPPSLLNSPKDHPDPIAPLQPLVFPPECPRPRPQDSAAAARSLSSRGAIAPSLHGARSLLRWTRRSSPVSPVASARPETAGAARAIAGVEALLCSVVPGREEEEGARRREMDKDKRSSQSPCGVEFITIIALPLLELFRCIAWFCCLHGATVAGVVSSCRCNSLVPK